MYYVNNLTTCRPGITSSSSQMHFCSSFHRKTRGLLSCWAQHSTSGPFPCPVVICDSDYISGDKIDSLLCWILLPVCMWTMQKSFYSLNLRFSIEKSPKKVISGLPAEAVYKLKNRFTRQKLEFKLFLWLIIVFTWLQVVYKFVFNLFWKGLLFSKNT